MLAATIQKRLQRLTSAGQVELRQLRLLRMQQEELIIRHITESSKFDIYAEMGKVCPTINNINSIPEEELMGMVNSASRDNFHSHPSPRSE
jgi:hypothetical protein